VGQGWGGWGAVSNRSKVGNVETPLNASATTAGTLIASSRFHVPQFQREYAWEEEDVKEFWNDLRHGLDDDSYFLGLVILTGTGTEKDVVDGQQRLLTVTLLASALYHEAMSADRKALADRLRSTFLWSIDFDTDEELPRLSLSGPNDAATLARILTQPAEEMINPSPSSEVSLRLVTAYRTVSANLREDLQTDRFRRLGIWADFLTNRVYFANFVHPDPASAYKVFEIVNTRGKELTTADLLKSYVLSQTKMASREQRYEQWNTIATRFPTDNPNAFVQFIRHAVTVRRGHVLPKDLYDVLAGRRLARGMGPDELMSVLDDALPLYLQMMDPTGAGPASQLQLGVFSALQRLGVISVRPILLAMEGTPDADDGMAEILKLVARRVVVGNLGTGNIERRFGQAAQRVASDRSWHQALTDLSDLNPDPEDFRTQLHRRSLNKNVLAFIRESILQRSVTPASAGYLHLIMPRYAVWPEFSQDRASYWASTIGNTLLVQEERRPQGTGTWEGVLQRLVAIALPDEWTDRIRAVLRWDEHAVSDIGLELAEVATGIWY